MRRLIRSFAFSVVALWFTTQLVPTLVIIGNWQTLVAAGLVLTLLNLIISPILKILFIPINFITFGLLSWFVNVIILYLLTLFVPQVQIHEWNFPGASLAGFVIPPTHLSYFLSLVISSILVTLFSNVLHFLSED